MLESWCGKVVEGGIEMTEIFSLARWAGNDVAKTGKEHWRGAGLALKVRIPL